MKRVIGKMIVVIFGIVAVITAIYPAIFGVLLHLMVRDEYNRNPGRFNDPITIDHLFSFSLWNEVWLLACEIWIVTLFAMIVILVSKKWLIK